MPLRHPLLDGFLLGALVFGCPARRRPVRQRPADAVRLRVTASPPLAAPISAGAAGAPRSRLAGCLAAVAALWALGMVVSYWYLALPVLAAFGAVVATAAWRRRRGPGAGGRRGVT